MKGRKPSPATLKILEAVQASQVNFTLPAAPPGFPTAPKYLETAGLEEFDRLTGLLDSMRILTQADGPALGFFAVYHSTLIKALREVETTGLFTVGGNGQTAISPAWKLARETMRAMLQILIECGLTPMSRTRVRIRDNGARDDLETFLNKKA